MKLIAAPWIVAPHGPPLEGGAVAVDGGRIVAAGPLKELAAQMPAAEVEHWDDAALIPALVNAHTHLELTGLGSALPGGDFFGWIRNVIDRKRQATVPDHLGCLARGLRDCLHGGQATVADVVSVGGLSEAYPCHGPRIRMLPEFICPDPAAAPGVVEAAASVSAGGCAEAAGLFAHAPYTVCGEAYRLAHRAAVARGGRLFTHLAESPEEVRYCRTGSGEVAERLYAELPVEPPPVPGVHPLEHLQALGVLDAGTVLVHAVQLEAGHVERIRASGASVVLCPRSNRHLDVGDAPGRRLLDAGVPVALGTDSALSGGSLDLWEDARLAVDAYGWSPEEALRAVTSGGAKVLGLEDRIGAIAPGFQADILAVRLGEGGGLGERILGSGRVAALWIGGEQASLH